ncbi:cupin domain-containing protein [Vineibacter terrae]|uniref:cupin domain-containing protein n=1 Tax=Vineibacter terrae TaxID=2586908 RepID=UPI002E3206D3|nr:cupin domain-containing protein [Vineibacter terrae]HEX2886716.1 cupin domain-containing protein [Vineibacter terrae]
MGTRMRIANMPTQPQQNENHRLVRTVFKRAELLQSSVLAVEHSTYFANGFSPVHAEDDSEEVIYFRRGRGKVLLGNQYVDVVPGSAVAIPSGIRHQVVNSGEDVLEHILISADLANKPPAAQPVADTGDYIVGPDRKDMGRLTCRRFSVAQGERSGTVKFTDRETVYAISSGYAVVHVGLPDGPYEWEYSLDAAHCVWLPPGRPHSFRNVGDCPVHVTGFMCVTGAA